MVFPREAKPGEESAAAPGVAREPPVPVPAVLTLRDALRIATRANREYTDRTEGLYLSALSLTGARYQFSPRLSSTISYVVRDSKRSEPSDAGSADLTATQVLPTGGTVTAGATLDTALNRNLAEELEAGIGASASLVQPLLRGAGYEASHEALTRAEREVVYAIRDFARFREQFLLDVTRRHYDILSQRAVLRNTEERYKTAKFQTARTQALFEIGTQDKIEVLRAENDLLRVENDLVDARDALSLAVDQFKVFLGLPTTVQFELAEEEPAFLPVDVSLDSAVKAALANRFDLANRREQVEDAERALRIARRDLLPDLSLRADWSGNSIPASSLRDQSLDTQDSSLGLFLEIPIQQTLERNAFRGAEIALGRERRDFERFRDEIVVEVRETLRRLRQAAVSLQIQERIIEVENKRAEKAKLDFEAGRIGNRDLLESEQSLLDARNGRVQRVVEYELARINLERAMGTLEVEPDGSWRVLRAPAPAAKADAGAGGRNP
jgi:outer membrane protein TolC